MIVKRAEEERASRADFQAVLDHDGLIWHRSQNQVKSGVLNSCLS